MQMWRPHICNFLTPAPFSAQNLTIGGAWLRQGRACKCDHSFCCKRTSSRFKGQWHRWCHQVIMTKWECMTFLLTIKRSKRCKTCLSADALPCNFHRFDVPGVNILLTWGKDQTSSFLSQLIYLLIVTVTISLGLWQVFLTQKSILGSWDSKTSKV